MTIYSQIEKAAKGGDKKIAVLIDPDKYEDKSIANIAELAMQNSVDFIFTGGSIMFSSLNKCIKNLKKLTDIPVIIFPGNVMQISNDADGILFLSLISGRNPEFLIGHHVLAAPVLSKSGIEVLSTAYIIIENGKRTSVEYMSNTAPIPADKTEIAVATAMAGEMLGLRLCYLEAGSGASNTIGLKMISEVRKNISLPLIVGGGIKTEQEARAIYDAGADLIVIGNALEDNPGKIAEIVRAKY